MKVADLVRVPVRLLLDSRLLPSAKLLWMALRTGLGGIPATIAALERDTGISSKTLRKGLAQLGAFGWLAVGEAGGPEVKTAPETIGAVALPGVAAPPAAAAPPGAGAPDERAVPVPTGLVGDRRVGVQGKLLYGSLRLLPGFRYPSGQFTYPQLGLFTGTSPHTLKRAVGELVQAGWLHANQDSRLAPLIFTLRHPERDRARAEVISARKRLTQAPFQGEAIMREYLSLLIDSEDYEDNASPGFLVNPRTGAPLELDRFYPPDLAFEHNGPQHYGPTERFSAESADSQMVRDHIKLSICNRRGIRVVIIHSEDLSLEAMRQKVSGLAPVRDLTGHAHLVAFLEAKSLRYRKSADNKWLPTPR